jgi:hypothetical protein
MQHGLGQSLVLHLKEQLLEELDISIDTLLLVA